MQADFSCNHGSFNNEKLYVLELLTDESVWGVVWPEDFVVSDVKGKLFLYQ